MRDANESDGRKSRRLPSWDYTSPGWYFITICTKNHDLQVGKINQEKMRLSLLGRIAQKHWLRIHQQTVQTSLDDFVIMPNHKHGIIIITSAMAKRCDKGEPIFAEVTVGAVVATPQPNT